MHNPGKIICAIIAAIAILFSGFSIEYMNLSKEKESIEYEMKIGIINPERISQFNSKVESFNRVNRIYKKIGTIEYNDSL